MIKTVGEDVDDNGIEHGFEVGGERVCEITYNDVCKIECL